MRTFKLFLVAVTLFIFAACTQTATNSGNTANTNKPAANAPANAAANATPTAAPTVAAMTGAELYKTHCANCHQANGSGGKVTVDGQELEPDDLTTAKMADKPDTKYVEYIRDGFPDDGMPPFKDKINEQQMKDLIKYIRTDIQKKAEKPAAPANK